MLANDGATNPFPDTPLRVVAVRGVGGSDLPAGLSVSPSADRRVLTIDVADDAAIADAVVQYQVADATEDPGRFVWGTVRVSVRDRPEPVTALSLRSVGDRRLTLGWTPGVFNNAPIESFTVTLSSASTGDVVSSTTCSSSTCAVETPGNGRENAVRVAVTATNAVGTSDPTSLGLVVWSDLIPPAPATLASTPLDSGLRVSWTKPSDPSGASPIVAYDVTVGSVTQTVTVDRSDPAGTRYVQSIRASSIPNGTPVSFSVQSRNDFAGAAPQWNSASGSNTPAGAPLTASSPTADADRSSGTRVTVSWPGVFSGNGAAIQRYYVALSADGSLPSCSVAGVGDGEPRLEVSDPDGEFVAVGTATSHTFTGLTPNTDYRAVVYAYNGQGCTGSAEVSATPRQRPGLPSGATLSSRLVQIGDGSGLYSYTLDDVDYASGGGTPSYRYQLTVGGITRTGEAAIGELLIPTNGQWGQRPTLRLQVCESYGSDELCSDWFAYGQTGTVLNLNLIGLTSDGNEVFWDGAYLIDGVESPVLTYSCDNGTTWATVPAGPGRCTNTVPWHGIIVRAEIAGESHLNQLL